MNNQTVQDQIMTRKIDTLFLNLIRYGVEIENTEAITDSDRHSGIAFFISVPKNSYTTLEDGTEAAGENLAKWAKEVIIKHHDNCVFNQLTDSQKALIKNYIEFEYKTIVKFKTRDEVWTREREENATINMMAGLVIKNKFLNEEESGEN